jgi:hypothetical protein
LQEEFPGGNVLKHDKGWMTEVIMVELLREGMGQETSSLLKKRGMMHLDAFKGHLTRKVKPLTSSLNTDIVRHDLSVTGSLYDS